MTDAVDGVRECVDDVGGVDGVEALRAIADDPYRDIRVCLVEHRLERARSVASGHDRVDAEDHAVGGAGAQQVFRLPLGPGPIGDDFIGRQVVRGPHEREDARAQAGQPRQQVPAGAAVRAGDDHGAG
ncbi:hypothetical protein [Nonomuraea jabiensis]|uniref:Uncharacterized protein n=1 Tax=Nonomuraea jabiensis TaxID=882448 RepID=A0A7W9GEM9_9ACTN|nr:hypothetical protein [Nonomuraea jabiensis]MBB5782273.1 hypothetical protein [Nonomuraea jabiensis]